MATGMTTTAEELARLENEYDGHVWAMRHHTNEARRLLPMLRLMQDAVAREEAKADKQARKFLGASARRSA